MTWEELERATQQILDDAGEEFTGLPWIRTLCESAELFATVTRGFPEITTGMFLDPQYTFYRMHDPTQSTGYPLTSLVDMIAPLRITIAKTVLERTTLSSVCLANPRWTLTYGTPTNWFFIGATLLAFYPIPFQAMVADVTYVRVPPWDQLGTSSPYIARPWHPLLPRYAAAIALASEGNLVQAQAEFSAFVTGLGIPDPKFKPAAKQRGVTQVDAQTKVGTVE